MVVINNSEKSIETSLYEALVKNKTKFEKLISTIESDLDHSDQNNKKDKKYISEGLARVFIYKEKVSELTSGRFHEAVNFFQKNPELHIYGEKLTDIYEDHFPLWAKAQKLYNSVFQGFSAMVQFLQSEDARYDEDVYRLSGYAAAKAVNNTITLSCGCCSNKVQIRDKPLPRRDLLGFKIYTEDDGFKAIKWWFTCDTCEKIHEDHICVN